MLFRKHIVSTRTLLQLTVAVVFFVAAVGAAVAAGSGNPPLLVPYTANTVAGIGQYNNSTSNGYQAGYSGDQQIALPYVKSGIGTTTAVVQPGAMLNNPFGFTVDSVGDIYIADQSNDVIREVNAVTGVIDTVAGIPPTGCSSSGTGCSVHFGCADGVPAYGSGIGKGIYGVAVDSFGNVYFVDSTSRSVSVIYRGGQRVADFIALVNPGGIARSGGAAKVGYVYHIAGTMSLNPSSCAGLTGSAAGPVDDNLLAFEDTNAPGALADQGDTLNNPQYISLDSAGNIYVADDGDLTVRVINTQETPQTFFQYTIAPGHMRSVSNCNSALTVGCPALTTTIAGQGINGPVNAIVFNAPGGSDDYAIADAYGNLYQLDSHGTYAYAAAAYAGGYPLTNLLTVEAPTLSAYYSPTETIAPIPVADAPTPNELPLTYGNSYVANGNPAIASSLGNGFLNVLVTTNNDFNIRASALQPDVFGTQYFLDTHYADVSRIDQFTSDGTLIISNWANTTNGRMAASGGLGGGGSASLGNANVNTNFTVSDYSKPASFSDPWNCVFGSTSGGVWLTGPQTYDPLGDGCPAIVAGMSNSGGATGGGYYLSSDGLSNLYMQDKTNQDIREITVGTQFPATPVTANVPAWSSTTTYVPVNGVAPEVNYNGSIYFSLTASNTNNTPGAAPGSQGLSWALLSPVTQPIEVHFDASNSPLTGGATAGSFTSLPVTDAILVTAYTTNAFSIPAGSDFSIDTTTPEFPMGAVYGYQTWTENAQKNLQMWAGNPTCVRLGSSSPDASWDCLVYVKFNPTQPGLRKGRLLVTTANGSTYDFPLTGYAVGGQLAIDGGQQAVLGTTGLGSAAAVAVDSSGNVYTADPTNNQIVITPVSGPQTAISTGITLTSPYPGQNSVTTSLKGPMGVAVHGGNVFISDTGNNRILEYSLATKTATQLGNYLWIPGAVCDGGSSSTTATTNCKFTGFAPPGSGLPAPTSILNDPGSSVVLTTAPPQYQFKAPEGLAVDRSGNVYVADTGNGAVVEIPSNTALGGATPLLQFPGAPAFFTTPVAVAVDANGYIYVADTGNAAGQILQIAPGGGDLQVAGRGVSGSALFNVNGTIITAQAPLYTIGTSALAYVTSLPGLDGTSVTTANGVAVDAAGDVYISDSGTGTVLEAPATVGPNGVPFALSFSGLSTPAGLALDSNGNLYVADSGNDRVLMMNRQNPTVPFGNVPQDLASASGVAGTPAGCPIAGGSTPCTGILTVTNIGNQSVTLASPFLGATGNSEYTATTSCTGATILPGTTCTISPQFLPTADGPASASVTVNGTQSIALTANGGNPETSIALAASGTGVTGTSPSYGAATNSTPTITATVTQPHIIAAPTPSGTVTFSYAIDSATVYPANACGAPGSATVALNGSGVATYTLPAVGAGLVYTVSAVFNPGSSDTTDGQVNSTPIKLTAPPATAETVTATPVSYTYGQPVPAITGTESPTLPAGVTVSFVGINNGVTASQFSPPGSYPIQAVFSGTGFCSYGFPQVTSSGNQANVTEGQAPLGLAAGTYTTVYGSANVNFTPGVVVSTTDPFVRASDASSVSYSFSTLSQGGPTAFSSLLNVGTYTVYVTPQGKPFVSGDYKLTPNPPTPGTLTVTPSPSGIIVVSTLAACSTTTVNNCQAGANSASGIGTVVYAQNTAAAVAGAKFTITVNTLVTGGTGAPPTGTVTVYDTFIPITSTIFVPTLTAGGIPQPCTSTLTVNCVPSSVPVITPCTNSTASATCTPTVPAVTLTAGGGTFALPAYVSGTLSPYYTSSGAIIPGTHYFTFLYSGDAGSNGGGLGDYTCAVLGQTTVNLAGQTSPTQIIPGGTTCTSSGSVSTAMIVDNPDFTLTSTTGPISVVPGNIPNGNGLPSAPNQSTSNQQSAIIEIGGILSFGGTSAATPATISLSCAPQNPSYEQCFTGQVVVNPITNAVQLVNTVALPFIPYTTSSTKPISYTAPVIFDVQTPASLPLGFNTTSQLRTSASRMVLAFLPLGLLAFCVRRRRRLSKALWMLIAIATVGAGMSGCSGNQVDFYTPIPTGQQIVTVNAIYPGNGGTTPAETRSYIVTITIQ